MAYSKLKKIKKTKTKCKGKINCKGSCGIWGGEREKQKKIISVKPDAC